MNATAMALRQPLGCSSSCGVTAHSSSSKELEFSQGVRIGLKRSEIEILSYGFCDPTHVQYYHPNTGYVMSEKREKSCKDKPLKKMKKKQQLKLLKGLTRDLSTLSQIGFGLDSDCALLDQVKGNMISEAAELLLEQLQKVRADEKELKRKTKEKARLKAAAPMQNNVNCEMSSNSLSAESSDSERGEVIDMNNLKRADAIQIALQQVLEGAASTYQTSIVPTTMLFQPKASDTDLMPVVPSTLIPEENTPLQFSSLSNVNNKRCSGTGSETSPSSYVGPTCSKKIEVCMGGKCKKSGGGALLEEFQRIVGIEGAVSGCKCMGKCRDGPNVKLMNAVDGGVADNTVKDPANSLCIGVGMEDVNMIVANFLGESHNQLRFAAAS